MIEKAMKIAHEYNPQWHAVAEHIKWEINPNLRRTLGRAKLLNKTIEISGDHLANTSDEVLLDTVTHELAHIVAYYVYRDRGHGWCWRKTHLALGGNGKRCASQNEIGYAVRRNKIKRVVLQKKDGSEGHTTLTRWNRQRESYLISGFKYLRTIEIDNGVTRVIHEAPRIMSPEKILATIFTTIAAQSSK
jgi:predicted SprT family Zn-dependent metalloprotease